MLEVFVCNLDSAISYSESYFCQGLIREIAIVRKEIPHIGNIGKGYGIVSHESLVLIIADFSVLKGPAPLDEGVLLHERRGFTFFRELEVRPGNGETL